MLVQKYLNEALTYGKKAFNLEAKFPSSLKECNEHYAKASSCLRCAISFEKNEMLKTIYEQLNATYERRIGEIKTNYQQKHNLNFPDQPTQLQQHQLVDGNEITTIVDSDDSDDHRSESNQSLEQTASTSTNSTTTNALTHRDDIVSRKHGLFLNKASSSPLQNLERKEHQTKKTNKRPIITTSSDESGVEDGTDEEKHVFSNNNHKRKKRKDVEEIKSFIIDSKKKNNEHGGGAAGCGGGWKQIVGLESVIECIREATILPQKFPQLFVGERRPWRAILLYGPPGTGKTLLASTLASESEATFFSVSSADLLSKWVGQSEKKIKQLFEFAASRKPSIIFIDEIDSLCSARNDTDSETSRRIKTEFLVQMQGIGSREGVTVIGATNLPWDIDSAIRRRFEKRIYVPLPKLESRREIIKHNLRNTPHSLVEDNLCKLAELTDGYSGSDLSVVIRQAIMEPLRKCQHATHFGITSGCSPITGIMCSDLLEPIFDNFDRPGVVQISLYDISPEKLMPPLVSFEDFEKALTIIHPTLSKEDVEKYQEFSKIF